MSKAPLRKVCQNGTIPMFDSSVADVGQRVSASLAACRVGLAKRGFAITSMNNVKTMPKSCMLGQNRGTQLTSLLSGVILTILFSGCASIEEFYSENPHAKRIELIDYDGALKAEPVVGLDRDQLIVARESEDYFPIGSADYTGPGNQDWTGAMVRLGRKPAARASHGNVNEDNFDGAQRH